MALDTSPLLAAFVVSAMVSAMIALTARWHEHVTADSPDSGPQKIHVTSVPRVGGVALFLGFLAALFEAKFASANGEKIIAPMALTAALAVPFFAGLYEDVTKAFGPWLRLIATFVAAAIAYVGCSAAVVRFNMPLLDAALAASSVAPLLLSMFCVAGVAHAFNLSDGLNGLLAGLATVACGVIAFVAREQADTHVYVCALALAGACVGFLCFNFPRARLFAGDSGAYFVGTTIAILCMLLVARNPSVNPWLAFVAVLYPFTDTTFAIARRLAQRKPIMAPDAEHLHSLIAAFIGLKRQKGRNSIASSIVVTSYALFAAVAIVYRESTSALVITCAAFAITYSIAWFGLASRLSAQTQATALANTQDFTAKSLP